MGGEIGGGESLAGGPCRARDPGVDLLAVLGRREGEYDVAQEKPAVRPQHLVQAYEGDALPEIGQMMEGIFRDDDVRRRPVMDMAEKAAVAEFDVAQAVVGRAPAGERQHARGDVKGIDGAAAP